MSYFCKDEGFAVNNKKEALKSKNTNGLRHHTPHYQMQWINLTKNYRNMVTFLYGSSKIHFLLFLWRVEALMYSYPNMRSLMCQNQFLEKFFLFCDKNLLKSLRPSCQIHCVKVLLCYARRSIHTQWLLVDLVKESTQSINNNTKLKPSTTCSLFTILLLIRAPKKKFMRVPWWQREKEN